MKQESLKNLQFEYLWPADPVLLSEHQHADYQVFQTVLDLVAHW